MMKDETKIPILATKSGEYKWDLVKLRELARAVNHADEAASKKQIDGYDHGRAVEHGNTAQAYPA